MRAKHGACSTRRACLLIQSHWPAPRPPPPPSLGEWFQMPQPPAKQGSACLATSLSRLWLPAPPHELASCVPGWGDVTSPRGLFVSQAQPTLSGCVHVTVVGLRRLKKSVTGLARVGILCILRAPGLASSRHSKPPPMLFCRWRPVFLEMDKADSSISCSWRNAWGSSTFKRGP